LYIQTKLPARQELLTVNKELYPREKDTFKKSFFRGFFYVFLPEDTKGKHVSIWGVLSKEFPKGGVD
jgi:hypothetical protein